MARIQLRWKCGTASTLLCVALFGGSDAFAPSGSSSVFRHARVLPTLSESNSPGGESAVAESMPEAPEGNAESAAVAPPEWWDSNAEAAAEAEAQRLAAMTNEMEDEPEPAPVRSPPAYLVAEQGGELVAVPPEEEQYEWNKADFIGSEWRIGIQWEEDDKVQDTWIRFVDDFELEWGINARGSWEMSGPYLSFSRDFKFGWGGKRLFAAKLSRKQNEVFIDGLVRGWTPLCPATVMGQFQAVRLGVDRSAYGQPYWTTPEWQNEGLEDESAEEESEAAVEEPEPFWTGLAAPIDGLKQAIAPPGSATAKAIEEALSDGKKTDGKGREQGE